MGSDAPKTLNSDPKVVGVYRVSGSEVHRYGNNKEAVATEFGKNGLGINHIPVLDFLDDINLRSFWTEGNRLSNPGYISDDVEMIDRNGNMGDNTISPVVVERSKIDASKNVIIPGPIRMCFNLTSQVLNVSLRNGAYYQFDPTVIEKLNQLTGNFVVLTVHTVQNPDTLHIRHSGGFGNYVHELYAELERTPNESNREMRTVLRHLIDNPMDSAKHNSASLQGHRKGYSSERYPTQPSFSNTVKVITMTLIPEMHFCNQNQQKVNEPTDLYVFGLDMQISNKPLGETTLHHATTKKRQDELAILEKIKTMDSIGAYYYKIDPNKQISDYFYRSAGNVGLAIYSASGAIEKEMKPGIYYYLDGRYTEDKKGIDEFVCSLDDVEKYTDKDGNRIFFLTKQDATYGGDTKTRIDKDTSIMTAKLAKETTKLSVKAQKAKKKTEKYQHKVDRAKAHFNMRSHETESTILALKENVAANSAYMEHTRASAESTTNMLKYALIGIPAAGALVYGFKAFFSDGFRIAKMAGSRL